MFIESNKQESSIKTHTDPCIKCKTERQTYLKHDRKQPRPRWKGNVFKMYLFWYT